MPLPLFLGLVAATIGGTGLEKFVVSDDEFVKLCAGGNAEEVKKALAGGANANARDNNGWTALMTAAWNGHAVIVETLVTAGADVNARYKDGRTARVLAASKGHAGIVKILAKAGAR